MNEENMGGERKKGRDIGGGRKVDRGGGRHRWIGMEGNRWGGRQRGREQLSVSPTVK